MTLSFAITGGSRGLGFALARALSQLDHHIFTCARTGISFGCTWHHTILDILDSTSVSEWFSDIIKAEGVIDVAINNAGIMNSPAPIWEIEKEDFDLVIDVNIKGVANVLRSCVPIFLAQKHGTIVNLISGSTRKSPAKSGAYSASKAAIEILTKTLANELPSNIKVFSLIPGPTNTDMLRKIIGNRAAEFPDLDHWVERAIPLLLNLNHIKSGTTLTVPGRKAVYQ
ncbi:MAG: SDR family oxidoreductase [Deltaproteobacteria bacterium]|nr:SDR family oxidoreductase [Deltaproteobacteria bacterium]